jgi:MinD superfamily P-loop ATPase
MCTAINAQVASTFSVCNTAFFQELCNDMCIMSQLQATLSLTHKGGENCATTCASCRNCRPLCSFSVLIESQEDVITQSRYVGSACSTLFAACNQATVPESKLDAQYVPFQFLTAPA